MGEKDIYIEKLSQQLEQWKAEISELENHAEDAGEEVKVHCDHALDALKEYYESVEAKVEGWIESADDTWDDIEEKADDHLEKAASAMKAAINHIITMLG